MKTLVTGGVRCGKSRHAEALLAAGAPMARTVQVTPPENLTLSASVTMTWRISPKP